MCEYSSSKYVLPHWKCVLQWCAQFQWIDITSPESDYHNSNVSPIIRFNVYQHSVCCTVHVRRPFNENKQCQLCEASTDSIVTTELYTRKELVMME